MKLRKTVVTKATISTSIGLFGFYRVMQAQSAVMRLHVVYRQRP